MPAAARISDAHTCSMAEPGPVPVPHVGGPIVSGEPTVMIGYQPAARVGDSAVCVGPPDSIVQGEPTVIIGNQPAARQGDPTAHGGTIALGCPTVEIGSSPQTAALADAAATAAPFCERCARGSD